MNCGWWFEAIMTLHILHQL